MVFAFIVFLSFGVSLDTKWLSISNELSMARPTINDINPIELNYYY